jgi:peptidylprolyl isomerase
MPMRRPASILLPLLIAAAAGVTACIPLRGARQPVTIPPVAATPRPMFALRFIDVAPGTGALLQPRQCVYAHYTGWLTDGTRFDTSRDTVAGGEPRAPLVFPQGARRVIAGWDLGFEGMRVGGRRRLIIPYQLAYGERGRAPVIPEKAELIFDVELMGVADTLPRAAPVPGGGGGGGAGAAVPACPRWADVRAAG